MTAVVVVSGEVDIADEDRLRRHLDERVSGGGDIVVDVGGLSFIDVSGCRALVRVAATLPDGRHLVLVNVPEHLTRVLSLCGWADHPRLVLSRGPACGHDGGEGRP